MAFFVPPILNKFLVGRIRFPFNNRALAKPTTLPDYCLVNYPSASPLITCLVWINRLRSPSALSPARLIPVLLVITDLTSHRLRLL